jgi:hypothetical protein
LILVGRLAVIDEIFVDVNSDAGGTGTLEEADDLAGAAAYLDDDIVGVFVAGIDDTTTGIVVEVVEDRVLVADRVFPGVNGEVLPELSFVVETFGAE